MIDQHAFALAVVSSSSPDLSVSEKLALYQEAVYAAERINVQHKLSEARADKFLEDGQLPKLDQN